MSGYDKFNYYILLTSKGWKECKEKKNFYEPPERIFKIKLKPLHYSDAMNLQELIEEYEEPEI